MSIEAELIERYGESILDTPRQIYVPPRRAKPKHQLAVVPKAGSRVKLKKEIRQGGHKAHIARHRITKELTTNLVFTNALPAFAKHARSVLAEIPTRDILSLYGGRPRRTTEITNPFSVGQKAYRGEIPVTVDDVRGRSCIISWEMLGKRMQQSIHYTQLRPG